MISVVMGTYNGSRFLREQLESISAQSVIPGELVVSDDNSSDQTWEILEAFAARATFPVLLERNPGARGVTHNFGHAASRASGEIVFFADQDDRWIPTKVEDIMRAFESHPAAELVFSDGDCIDESGRPLGYTLFDCALRGGAMALRPAKKQFEVLLRGDAVTGAAMAIRSTLLRRMTPFPADWLHDAWLAYGAAVDNRIRVVPQSLFSYRAHEGQQVGVRTFWNLSQPASVGRDAALARMAKYLELRQHLLPELPDYLLKALDNKISHLKTRATLPKNMSLRVLIVFREALALKYYRYSTGIRSIVLDLIAT